MKHDAFRYDFTVRELNYFLFGKKICPRCGGKMEKGKAYETVNGSIFKSNTSPLFIQGAKVKHYYYIFTCRQCGAEYTLQELAKQK